MLRMAVALSSSSGRDLAIRRQLGNGAHPVAVPVAVEDLAGLPGHRADAKHVKVMEIEFGIEAEIFVTEIAPADDRDPVVDHHLLVVHAPVQALEVSRHAGATTEQRAIVPRD